MFTIKNYNQPEGVSLRFFQNYPTTFEVKGPMGKPLGVTPTGLHVCFAGGTGILPFMDLIGQLAFANLGLTEALGQPANDSIQPAKFKLRLYVSFQNKKESVGMELITALEFFCKKNGLDNFELHQRFSQEKINPARWDNSFIQRELCKGKPNEIHKILVCGPPVLNETFDRFFSNHGDDVRLSVINELTFRRDQIEVL